MICTGIPDPSEDPKLHQIVMSNMVHDPCGCINPNYPYMQNGLCSKKYPKQCKNENQLGADSYSLYRICDRDDGGQVSNISIRIGGSRMDQEVDNRWSVPYNKLLLRSMDCHCNVELCMSVKSIKYTLNNVHKGYDQAMFSLRSNQVVEISDYHNAEYVSSNEFLIHERDPSSAICCPSGECLVSLLY